MLSKRDLEEALKTAAVTGIEVGGTIKSLVAEIEQLERVNTFQTGLILKQRALLAQARAWMPCSDVDYVAAYDWIEDVDGVLKPGTHKPKDI